MPEARSAPTACTASPIAVDAGRIAKTSGKGLAVQTSELFDTTQVDLAALVEKNRKLRNENKRLRKLLRLARPIVEELYGNCRVRLAQLGEDPANTSVAYEIFDEMAPYKKLLDGIDRRMGETEGGRP